MPFYLSHTIVKAEGEDRVTGVTIAEVGKNFQFIEGTEKHFDVDTICMAVGLSPMSQLLKQAGCEMNDTPGGYVPVCDILGATSVPGIYAAGDVSGIEEASSAMIEGRILGAVISEYLGYMTKEERETRVSELESALEALRQGMFAPKNRGKKIEKTEEGIDIPKTFSQKVMWQTMRLSGIRALPMQSVFIRLWSVRRTFRVTHVRMPVQKDVFPSAITLHRCRLLCRVPNVSDVVCV